MTTRASRAVLTFPGLAPSTLGGYLAGLGLVRVLAEQADAGLMAWWAGDTVCAEVSVADPAMWLIDEYVPTPIVSPWNSGSGFGAKDVASRAALRRLMTADTSRMSDFASVVTWTTMISDRSVQRGWDKRRLVSELRNRCPEPLLPWLDACVVLLQKDAIFPPLLGTGGNDGRLDFSTNFHQRLIEVLPDLGAPRQRSLAWARDLLDGTATQPLIKAAVGQFEPGAAGGRNSSPFGAAESQVNPWRFVLMMEGALYFAAGAVRRHAAGSSRAAMPFCVYSDPDGPVPGADRESSRGEVWAPVWTRPLRAQEVSQLFAESRATWQGTPVTQSAQMYAALRSYGVARGLDRFLRFGLHRRNGLAFSAVKLDEVPVDVDQHIHLLTELERTAHRMSTATARSVTIARRSFSRHRMAYARRPNAQSLRDMLVDLTRADLAIMRSGAAREDVGHRRPLPAAGEYADFLHQGLGARREFRVATALASGVLPAAGGRRSVRDLLVGRMPTAGAGNTWESPVVPGLGVRPVVSVLADLMVWRARMPGESDATGVNHGFTPLVGRRMVCIPWMDLHAFVRGDLDGEEVDRCFLACLALGWNSPLDLTKAGGLPGPPVSELAVLQAFTSGTVRNSSGPDAAVLGLDPSWPRRFLTSQPAVGVVSPVISEATNRLRRAGWRVAAPHRDPTVPADRLLAALLARTSPAALVALGGVEPGREPEPREPDLLDTPIG